MEKWISNTPHTSFTAADRSYLSLVKKDLHAMAAQVGFSARKLAEVDIIVSEMGSNLVKHGGGGEILARLLPEENGLELISIDNGPGIADPVHMQVDGHSSVNTLGQGLGAMDRLSDLYQLYSQKNWGTIVLCRCFAKKVPARKMPVSFSSIVVAKPGETLCGDGFYARLSPQRLKVFLGDGLGHGAEAHRAVNEAIQVFKFSAENSPAEIIRQIHAEVRKTRGLVATVGVLDFATKTWKLCGVGNIASRITSGMLFKNYMPYNGIVGMNIPNTMKDQEIPPEYGQQLICCSDGLKTRWDNLKYPAIHRYDPTILAAALYKDYARKTDDMSVIVSKLNS